ncbi:MAG TPA: lipocalin-like domain-containing protein [Myxococcales bacterium]|nr:lipocalin-like domain-containing protein [Myxococcales bacterium]
MKTMHELALAALAALTLFASAAAAGNQKSTSLKQGLVGTWTMVSDTVDQNGTKVEPFGKTPLGSMTLTSDGHYFILITDPDVPKFATGNRTGGTAEENKAAMAGGIGYFGTYTVSEPDKTVYLRVVASTFPNWRGSDQKRVATLSGDDLTWTNPTPSIGAGNATLVWKRAKPAARQTAQK